MARRSRSGPASNQDRIADFLYSWDWIFDEPHPEPKDAVQMRTDLISLLYTLGRRVAHIRKEIAGLHVLERLATENIEVRFDDETGDEVDVIRTLVRRVDRVALKRIRKLIQQVSKLAVNAQSATPAHEAAPDQHAGTSRSEDTSAVQVQPATLDHADAPDQHARASKAADTTARRSKTGPKPMDHAKIYEICRKFAPWTEHVSEVCEELDRLGVKLPPAFAKSSSDEGIVTWTDLHDVHPEKVKQKFHRSRRESRKLRRR